MITRIGNSAQRATLAEAFWSLWATRVLDAKHGQLLRKYGDTSCMSDAPRIVKMWSGKKVGTDRFTVTWWGSNWDRVGCCVGYHETPDLARIAAAVALVANDPALSPKGWP